MNNAFYITAQKLAETGFENAPKELFSAQHLIYSSPATLYFNSPGAQGFGVKRAGLAIPDSVMLLVSPACCGRNTTMLSQMGGYADRFFYLLLDDTDIVTGRHLTKIPQAVKEVCETLDKMPSAVMICITCVDALLGTDMERVCRKSEDCAGVPVVPCYMYALTREKRLPPMAAVRKSVYSLLKPSERKPDAVNILGYFAPLNDDSEIYDLLSQAGVKTVKEISRCKDFNEYLEMSKANFSLVLNPECRYAAQEMEKKLGIPSIELVRLYQTDKIHNQYMSFANAVGAKLDDEKFRLEAENAISRFKNKFGEVTFAIGEMLNADAFELAWAMIKYGFKVSEIYGTIGERNFIYVKNIAKKSPETKIFSNLDPSMMYYDEDEKIDVCIGCDAAYYHKGTPFVEWNEERQPFGYAGVKLLFERLYETLDKEGK